MTWVGDFHIWGPGIRPNPSESDTLPNPSESGIHFCRVKMPIQTVEYRKKIPCGAARNPPESARIRPSNESVRIRKRQPRTHARPWLKVLQSRGVCIIEDCLSAAEVTRVKRQCDEVGRCRLN